MKKLVVANLKMNLNNDEIRQYVTEINNKKFNKMVVICPTSIYIPYFLKQSYDVGIQNIFYEEKGAFTGEISPSQAYSLGINYAIIGHSERRSLGEDDFLINKKTTAALNNNMNVILCVGETKEERDKGLIDVVISKQLDKGLKDVNKELLNSLIVAYEPRWAIGNGITPTKEEIEEITAFIKKHIKEKYNFDIKVLYGGSVNESNICELNNIEIIDGFLVGGASLNSDKLVKIVEVVSI